MNTSNWTDIWDNTTPTLEFLDTETYKDLLRVIDALHTELLTTNRYTNSVDRLIDTFRTFFSKIVPLLPDGTVFAPKRLPDIPNLTHASVVQLFSQYLWLKEIPKVKHQWDDKGVISQDFWIRAWWEVYVPIGDIKFEEVAVSSELAAKISHNISILLDHLSLNVLALFQKGDIEKLLTLLRTDELTGVMNRRAFYTDMANNFNATSTKENDTGLIFLDVDNFSEFNTNYGHVGGDLALKHFSQVANKVCEAYGAVFYRTAWDEFNILCRPQDLTEIALSLLMNLRSNTAKFVNEKTQKYDSVSITASIWLHHEPYRIIDPSCREDFDIITSKADKQAYLSKKAGRNKAFYQGKDIEHD